MNKTTEPPTYNEAIRPIQPTEVIIIESRQLGCIDGQAHYFTTEFSLCAILLSIIFFPIGLIFCLCMTHQRCIKCGRLFY